MEGWSVSFSGGVAAYAVAHYLPLDGTVFRNSRSVDSRPCIGMVTFGMTVRHRGFVGFVGKTLYTKTVATERERTEVATLGTSWYL